MKKTVNSPTRFGEDPKKLTPEPTYVIDEIARKHGHEVMRTPPYHPELQPIETCWGVVKKIGRAHV